MKNIATTPFRSHCSRARIAALTCANATESDNTDLSGCGTGLPLSTSKRIDFSPKAHARSLLHTAAPSVVKSKLELCLIVEL
jgi:hypothetical protein